MAAQDKRTRCAIAAQDWQSRNHRSHAQDDAPKHRQTPQSEMVNYSAWYDSPYQTAEKTGNAERREQSLGPAMAQKPTD